MADILVIYIYLKRRDGKKCSNGWAVDAMRTMRDDYLIYLIWTLIHLFPEYTLNPVN